VPQADEQALNGALDALASSTGREAGELRARFAMFRHHVEAVARHAPRVLGDVPVTHLRATPAAGADTLQDAAAAWRGLCDRLVSACIPGDHFSCMQAAQVGQWVEHLWAERTVEEVL
jgi:thioesterase domain-containing protein